MNSVNTFSINQLLAILPDATWVNKSANIAQAEQPIFSGIAPLNEAQNSDISFLANPKYQSDLNNTSAGCLLVSETYCDLCPSTAYVLVVKNPYQAYAQLSQLFVKDNLAINQQISDQASIHPTASIGKHVTIAPGAVIGANTSIGDKVYIGANVVVGERCHIAQGVILHPNVTIYSDCSIGEDSIIHSGAVIGADGFGYAPSKAGYIKIAQLGGVSIAEQVEIGAGTTIDSGALSPTVICRGVKIDNQVQIAHNVFIDEFTAIAAQSGIAGSTRIGKWCTIAGGVGIVGHITVADKIHVTAMSMVTKSLTQAGSYSSGTVLQKTTEWRKNAVRFSQLDKITKQVKLLIKR